MVVHHTLQLLTITYHDEPTHIFTDCLNVLYLLNTQLKHPTIHNGHPYKKILESMVNMLQICTQTTTLHKVKAHINIIKGKEEVDTLAKRGYKLDHRDPTISYEHAHPTSYYLQKIGGTQCTRHQTKDPFGNLENMSSNTTKDIT